IITKVVLPVLILVFFISCITQAPSPIPAQKPPTPRPTVTRPPKPPTPPRDRDYYDDLRNRDRDRDSVLSRARDKSKKDRSPDCEGDDDCEDICSDIYSSRADKNDCEEKLSVNQVEQLEIVSEAFEDPDLDDLEELDLEDVEVYLNISIEPLHKLIAKYNSREARDFLTWIAQNADAAEVLEDEDDDYEVLYRLFGRIHTDKYFEALEVNLDGGDNFMDLSVEADNEFALEWVYEYIEDKEANCSSETTGTPEVNCLKSWCKLGADMDPDYAEELPEYRFFESYLDHVIGSKINGEDDEDDGDACGEVGDKDKWNGDISCQSSDDFGYIGEAGDLVQWWKGDSTKRGLCPIAKHAK
ncbi:MAG: hypothetical protein ACR2M7_03915, partial [Bdellovibrionales bacterium]